MNSFGEKLRYYRTAARLTQRNLADKVGVSHQVISNLERGYTTGVSVDMLNSLAAAVGVSVSEFSDGADAQSKKAASEARRPLSAAQQRLLTGADGLDNNDIEKVIEYAELLKLKRTE